MHLVPRWILSSFPTCPTHLMNPLAKARALLQREVPPDILEGAVPRNLLPCGNEPSNVVGVDVVALVVGDGVHSGKTCREVEKRGIVGFLVKATRKEVLTTQPSNGPSLI